MFVFGDIEIWNNVCQVKERVLSDFNGITLEM